MPGGAGSDTLLDRQTLDSLLAFSPPLPSSTDYWGVWNTSSLLLITFGRDVAAPEVAASPAIGHFTATCRPGNDIQSAAAPSSECSSVSPPLRGAWGYPLPPETLSIQSFVALDADNADDVCASGDTLTITFNVPTDRAALGGLGGAVAGAMGGPEPAPLVTEAGMLGALNDLLEFSPPIPNANLSAAWASDSVLVITVLGLIDAADASDAAPSGRRASEAGSGALGGSDEASGELGSGADGGSGIDGGSGADGGNDADGGSGADGGTDEATAAAASAASVVDTFGWLGNLRVSIRPSAALRTAAHSSRATSAASPVLTGDCGLPPQISAFEAADTDDGDAICAAGDTLTLRFDRPTTTPPASTRVEVDRLLTFSQALGIDYSGAWCARVRRAAACSVSPHSAA